MVRSRSEVPSKEKWNVEALYPSMDEWKKVFEKARRPKLSEYQGKLKSPSILKEFFDKYFAIDRELSRLYTYAHLRFDEDLGSEEEKKSITLIRDTLHDFQYECAWVEPELLRLEEPEFQALLRSKELEGYRFYLEQVGRRRPHTLPAEQEALLALSSKPLSSVQKAFSALNNADLTFDPAVDKDGAKHPLTHGSYSLYLKSPDRALRKSAFENIHKGFASHINTLTEIIQGQVQTHAFFAKARKYPSCLEAALYTDNIPTRVYTQLIETVKKNLPILHKYMRLRKELMGLPDLHVYDLYVPLVPDTLSMKYEEACEAVIASVKPLGEAYQKAVRKGLLEERWVDIYENARKRSGAYSSGCYDSMPYILLNYQGAMNDVLTLAHEMGHSMHSYLSRKEQPYVYSQYPIFVAEVASIFNEQLLLDYLKRNAKSPQEKKAILSYQIEGIRGTFFRQVLFAEFELKIHRLVEEGTPLTPDLLKEYYVALNCEYYGPDFVADEGLQVEWARIPHFYYNFYVYQYATGLSAAVALFQSALESESVRDRYLAFLSSGGSQYPLDLLLRAGIDISKADPIESALCHFERLIEEFKTLDKA